jgi:hypothetical protein
MNREPVAVHHQGSTLLVVPAVHYHHVFAHEVNRICCHPATRPEAVAVELGPQSAVEVRAWLGELGIGARGRRRLPVMLGLTRRNRTIRASFREKAYRLQQETGKDLYELPPDLLDRELGYAGSSLLCLSPTDSIIEAIRCSAELNVPVYGVDLEESAAGDHLPVLIPDPLGAADNVPAYVLENSRYAAQSNDEETDSRREIAMAARLKSLLREYGRVLFTCGLAHWLRIRSLLDDPAVRPALLSGVQEGEAGRSRRVVVHPLIAARHMDLFPRLVQEYERCRGRPSQGRGRRTVRGAPDPAGVFKNLLEKTYGARFKDGADDRGSSGCLRDLASLPAFEGHLAGLCLFAYRLVPDVFTAVKAAQQTMSPRFVEVLSKTFLDFPWASPDKFPDCALLAPAPEGDGTGQSLGAVFIGGKGKEGGVVYVRSRPAPANGGVKATIPYVWEQAPRHATIGLYDGVLHTWPPWDSLISSLSVRAVGQVTRRRNTRAVRPFEGSLLEGIDVKATVRAHAGGKETVYVRDTAKEAIRDRPRVGEGFPVVWILEPGEHEGAVWNAFYEDCHWMVKHVRDKARLEQVTKTMGDKMIALIGYGQRAIETGARKVDHEIRTDHFHGILMYQPICWTSKQFSRWAELSRYRRNPYCRNCWLGEGVSSDLTALYQGKHGVVLGKHDWTTSLLLLGIPFAEKVMTAVLPDGHSVDPVVLEMAARYKVQVCVAPLGSFTKRERERLAINHMAPALVREPRCIFSKAIEKAIGEKQSSNRDLVPSYLLDFGDPGAL